MGVGVRWGGVGGGGHSLSTALPNGPWHNHPHTYAQPHAVRTAAGPSAELLVEGAGCNVPGATLSTMPARRHSDGGGIPDADMDTSC
jgi:hypothetical protein